jgi:cytochrome c553
MSRLVSQIVRMAAALAVGIALVATRRRRSAWLPREESRPDAERGRSSVARGPKHWLWHAALVLVVLGAAGFLGVVAGIVPIAASAGHWPITRWFLSFAMQRAVATHSLGVTVPSLDEPWLVLKGAGHYEFGCRPCHGSPEIRRPRIPLGMTPFPPYLPPLIPGWQPDELYYIVKHGVKFTGMPAWPAVQRDDEVWAMVAFLRRLPGLDATEYRRLVSGEASPTGDVVALPGLLGPRAVPRAIAESCGRCHGVDGNGRGLGAFPKLAGQRPAYLLASLQAFALGERHSGVMEPIAAGLGVEDMRELAGYYASRPKATPSSPSRPDAQAMLEVGQAIAEGGIPERRVPACSACHGPGTTPRNPIYPELAGQYPEYLALQLMLFRNDVRGGTAYAHIMRMVASRLTPEQIRAAALYYASLPPALERPVR